VSKQSEILNVLQRNTIRSAMNSAITVRLDESLQKRLESVSRKTGVSRSDIIRGALKRQLAILAFETHRETAMPFAEARGFLTDEDVFKEVS
jgi:predicted transcriptional regulator